MWRELNRYGGKERAREAFKKGIVDQTFLSRFMHLTTLADGYFLTAEDAGEMIDCLLLYYGAMSLGQAVAFSTLPSDRMSAKSPTHGLDLKLDTSNAQPFLRSRLHVTEAYGTFNVVNQAFGGDDLSGSTFSILDLLCALPDLDEPLLSVIGKGTDAVEFQQLWYNVHEPAGRFHAKLSKTYTSLEHILSKVAISEYLKKSNVELDGELLKWDRNRTIGQEETATVVTSGVRRFLFPTVSKKRISEFGVHLGILYALSILCRYHADIWVPMFSDVGDEYYVIREFVQITEEKIPQLALNHFTRATHSYHTKMAMHIPAVRP